jgi:hypothetical protein
MAPYIAMGWRRAIGFYCVAGKRGEAIAATGLIDV